MAGVAEPGTGLLTRCILMRRGCWGSFALHRKGILRVLRTRALNTPANAAARIQFCVLFTWEKNKFLFYLLVKLILF